MIKFKKENIDNFEIVNPQNTKIEDYKNLQFDDLEHMQISFLEMLESIRELRIISFDLNAWFFNDEYVINILKKFLLDNLRNKIYVLVKDDKTAVAEGSLFISLARRLPSQFQIKVISSKLESYLSENMFIFGKNHYMRFYDNTLLKGDGSFNNETYAYKMYDEFESAFVYAKTSLELRDMLL